MEKEGVRGMREKKLNRIIILIGMVLLLAGSFAMTAAADEGIVLVLEGGNGYQSNDMDGSGAVSVDMSAWNVTGEKTSDNIYRYTFGGVNIKDIGVKHILIKDEYAEIALKSGTDNRLSRSSSAASAITAIRALGSLRISGGGRLYASAFSNNYGATVLDVAGNLEIAGDKGMSAIFDTKGGKNDSSITYGIKAGNVTIIGGSVEIYSYGSDNNYGIYVSDGGQVYISGGNIVMGGHISGPANTVPRTKNMIAAGLSYYYLHCKFEDASPIDWKGDGTDDISKYSMLYFKYNIPEGSIDIDEAHFPDDIFRSYVEAHFDSDHDGYLSRSEMQAAKKIDLLNKGVTTFEGIEYLAELEELNCHTNQITSLDVSKNIKLRRLSCSVNNLGSLDVSKNVNLEYLYCGSCNLTSLDLRNNKKLTFLNCKRNKLTSLDLSQNVLLRELNCSNNMLTSLDLSSLVNLISLVCINNQLTSLDAGSCRLLENLYCEDNMALTTLIVSKEAPLLAGDFKTSGVTLTYKEDQKTETSDPTAPPASKPETEKTETTKPETTKPETTKPETTKPAADDKASGDAASVVPTKIKLNAKSIVLQVRQSTTALKVTNLMPGEQVTSWKSSNKKVFTVTKKGRLKAGKKTGKAKLTIKTSRGQTKTIMVKVQKGTVKTSKISVEKKITVKKGKKYRLHPSLTPITSQQKVKYKSSNKKVAVVNSKGVVTGKKAGTAVITITSGKRKTKCRVTVTK